MGNENEPESCRDTQGHRDQSQRAPAEGVIPIHEIVFLIFCGTLQRLYELTDIQEWGEENLEWLRKYSPFNNGIPSHDTLGRVLSMFKPSDGLLSLLRIWAGTMHNLPPVGGRVHLAVDGKAMCGTARTDADGKRRHQHAVHAVRADLPERPILDWGWVEEKSNEITANPTLLERLDLAGTLVSLDAIGLQRGLVKQIVEQGGDILVAVKDNQKTLTRHIRGLFQNSRNGLESVEKDHGRTVKAKVFIKPIPLAWKQIPALKDWPFRTAILVRSQREAGSESEFEERLYATTCEPDTPKGDLVRFIKNHWAVEMAHHTLDGFLDWNPAQGLAGEIWQGESDPVETCAFQVRI